MDLGLTGKTALVCGASKGLGKGCAQALAREGANVVLVARGAVALHATVAQINTENSGRAAAVVCDITTAQGRALALNAMPYYDIVITNAGGPPPGDFRNWSRDDWIQALDANMLTPIELIKATVDGMMQRGFGRIVNITSSAVKAPIDVLGLSNGARSGLTGFVAGLARKTVAKNVTINNLLPGPFDTDRLAATMKAWAAQNGQTEEQAREQRRMQNPAQRFGTIDEFGAVCAFLCSVHAGYINAQNVLMDGGAYPGTF